MSTPPALAPLRPAQSLVSHDAVYAMAEAMEAAGSTDYADVVAALQSLNYQDAVTGSISFDSNGDPIKSVTIIKLVNGVHVVETKVNAS